jgi:hypothetical protein
MRAMTDGEKLAGVMQSSATEFHCPIRGYVEDAEGMANSTTPHVRPWKATDVVAAMAGGEELTGDGENGPRSHQTRKRQHGEEEESEAKLTERKTRSGDDSTVTVATVGRTLLRRIAAAVSLLCTSERERGKLEKGRAETGSHSPF